MDLLEAQNRLSQAHELVHKLERISADSTWAHLSSGYRGSLWRAIDRLERLLAQKTLPSSQEIERLDLLMQRGYDLLYRAAREIPYQR
jgi:uncharacterized coiled-coil DUF342 family protein